MATRKYYSKELYHHGIKGQKWGIRNYQNKDGSYTTKGRYDQNGHGRYSELEKDNKKINSAKSNTNKKKY